MKVWTCLLALVVCVGFVGTAHAAKGAKKLRGKITSVSDDGKVVVKPGKAGDEVTVETDDKTSVTIDGKDAKVKDLKAGLFVMVTPNEGTATTITATTTRARKGGSSSKPTETK